MRFFGFALAASAFVLGACGGGDTAATDTSAAAAPTTDAAAPAAPAAGAVAAAPVTGTVHTVNMVGDAQGYRYEPANLTIKQGDGVKFVMVSGGPHDVSFQDIPAEVAPQLSANIPEKMGELSSKMMMNPNEEVTISFANIPAGTYNFHCTPHLAMGMTGAITVE
ncbi:MAG TPA: plastocyanin/azurin family copper-binding protein [Gemmatimonadales bacterium]